VVSSSVEKSLTVGVGASATGVTDTGTTIGVVADDVVTSPPESVVSVEVMTTFKLKSLPECNGGVAVMARSAFSI
jgi:hypothetical protein